MTRQEKADLSKQIKDLTDKVNKVKAITPVVSTAMTTQEKNDILNQLRNLTNIVNKIKVNG